MQLLYNLYKEHRKYVEITGITMSEQIHYKLTLPTGSKGIT